MKQFFIWTLVSFIWVIFRRKIWILTQRLLAIINFIILLIGIWWHKSTISTRVQEFSYTIILNIECLNTECRDEYVFLTMGDIYVYLEFLYVERISEILQISKYRNCLTYRDACLEFPRNAHIMQIVSSIPIPSSRMPLCLVRLIILSRRLDVTRIFIATDSIFSPEWRGPRSNFTRAAPTPLRHPPPTLALLIFLPRPCLVLALLTFLVPIHQIARISMKLRDTGRASGTSGTDW